MPRLSKIKKLQPEVQAQVDAIIRRHRYADLDGIKLELDELGIDVSRSAVGRYAIHLAESDSLDSLNSDGAGSTLVVVIDGKSDRSSLIRTSASPDAVVSAISAITSHENDDPESTT